MIILRNRLVWGIIKNTIKAIFSVLYQIIALLNLQVPVLILLIGVIMFFTGVFENNAVVLTIFYVLLAISIVSAIVMTIKKILGIDSRVKKSKGAQIIRTENQTYQDERNYQAQTVQVEQESYKKESPTYYKVKQNPNFIMAEYSDRYILYKRTEDGLKKIRTDYK